MTVVGSYTRVIRRDDLSGLVAGSWQRGAAAPVARARRVSPKVTATVREWRDEEGWGVLDSPETPGGCFGPLLRHPDGRLPRTGAWPASRPHMGSPWLQAGWVRLPSDDHRASVRLTSTPAINDSAHARSPTAHSALALSAGACSDAPLIKLLKRVSQVRILPGAPRAAYATNTTKAQVGR